MSVFGLSREHVGGDVCPRCPRELFVCWGVSTWPPLHRTSGIAVGTVRRSCSGRGSLCRALGAGAGCAVLDSLSYLLHNLDIPSGPVCRRLAGVQPGRWGHHSVMVPVFLGGSGSNARAQEARPAPVYRFHPHFLVQSDVNLSLEKGGRACSRWRHCSRSPGGPTTQHVPGRRCRPESRDRRDGSTPFSIVLSSLTALILGKV